MSGLDAGDTAFPGEPSSAGVTRRRLLAGFGVLAGAAALVPLLERLTARRMDRVEVSRPALGTWVRVVARHGDPARASRGVERAFAAIQRVDEQMSIHRPGSQIARVNAMAGRGPVAVAPAVVEVVSRACAAARRSGGIYDPTVLALMRLYGFYRSAGRYPTDRAIGDALGRTGWNLVTVDRTRGMVGLTREGMGLDLGSIGKGWAVDQAVAALEAEGIASGLVDVGGNVYGLGVPEDGADGWSVGVMHPVSGRVDRVFQLRDAALATSGNYNQGHLLGGVHVGHLMDAVRGRPSDGHLSASACARTGVEADELSTVAFLLGPGRMGDWPEGSGFHFIG
jgi:thiamine biosynthesis lipoprotein